MKKRRLAICLLALLLVGLLPWQSAYADNPTGGGLSETVFWKFEDGTLTISGGKISGGTAVNGGNIFVQGCSFPDASLNITGGIIENGTATTGELCNQKLMVKETYNGDIVNRVKKIYPAG